VYIFCVCLEKHIPVNYCWWT